MTVNKFCPFTMSKEGHRVYCTGNNCACWIELQKPNPQGNPFYHLEYTGCGLIQHIPWRPIKTEQKAK